MKKNIVRKRKSKKGIALIIAVMFSMVMIIIAGIILKLAQGHYHSSAYQVKHTKAFYLANAGVEWAIYGLRMGTLNPAPPHNGYVHTVSTSEGNVAVTIDIKNHTGDPTGVVWDIVSKVDPSQIKLK